MKNIHINSHFAVGIILASITNYFSPISFMEFGIIVGLAFFNDADILLSKHARDNNHRMLITHSIIPGMIILLIGIFLNILVLIIGGIAYLLHILIDTMDWGTNFLGIHEKPFGPKFLITNEELENLPEILSNYKIKKAFFDFRYYESRVIIFFEILLLFLMILMNVLLAIEYIVLIFLYFPLLLFHLSAYFHMKKVEKSE